MHYNFFPTVYNMIFATEFYLAVAKIVYPKHAQRLLFLPLLQSVQHMLGESIL